MPSQVWDTTYYGSLFMCFKFEDNFNDTTGDAYHLTAHNTPTYVAGKFGNAAHFISTSSQYADRLLSNLSGVSVATTQTWMFWINVASFTAGGYIFGMSNGGYWFVNCSTSGALNLQAGLSVNHGVALPSEGVWHHVVFAYNSTTSKISSWLNGVIVQNDVTATGTWTSSGSTFAVGRIGDYAGYGTFSIDDLAFYNGYITQAQVNEVMSGIKKIAGVTRITTKVVGKSAIGSTKKVSSVY